ncbi:nitrous oxide reductase family maturation protein NosD [Arthrobacter citreus]|uniref:right-handed parallel beta-helix repeat-containing protein n=1 Tax=Arthrobacter TaxID=1663 RepID=UPI0012643567|nr:right-handed parallel beta-helix repeat-containing protein [Arthrobacter gandavensis]
MSRSVQDGWGESESGTGYTTSWLPSLAVSGGTGTVEIPEPGTSRTVEAGVSPAVDMSASYGVSVSEIPTSGGGVHTGLQVRYRDGSFYQATLRVLPGGDTALDISRTNGGPETKTALSRPVALPFRVDAGQKVNVELQATGSSPVEIKARAWLAGATAGDWQQTASDSGDARITDAGTLRITTYVSAASQPATVAYDDLAAQTLRKATGPVVPPPAPAPVPPVPPVKPPVNPAPPTVPEPPTLPQPPTVPEPPAEPGSRNATGSAPVGSTSYPIPSRAVFAAPGGSDSAAGTLASPLRTIGAAIARAPQGGTVVLRGGTYHEEVTIPVNKPLTIQAYPNEAVWLDGSRQVSNFVPTGKVYAAAGWTPTFDSSPTYQWGKPGTEHGGSFVDPAYPMASHPDQVWIDNAAQKQVGSLSEVTAGTFYADYAAKKLYVGTNPAGKTVRASALAKAMSVRAENSVVRGIGIRRFATSVPHMGAVTVEKTGVVFENVSITDNSTTGIAVGAGKVTLRNVTSARNGLMGVSVVYADGLTVTGLDASGNNVERFKTAPVAGGMKVGRTRGVSVQQSTFRNNTGTGLWLDESVYNADLAGNAMTGNASHGVSAEISAKVRLVDNVIADNRNFGVKVNNTSEVEIWNNTFSGNGRQINIVQDKRRASNQSTPGHNPRQPFPDKTMTWINGPVTVRNNIIASTSAAGNCLLCVEDYSREFTAEQLRVTAQGNVYHRVNAQQPSWAVVWSGGKSNASVYTGIAAFRAATGQEKTHLELTGPSPLAPNTFAANRTVQDQAGAVAVPLPASIAGLAGQPSGARHLGAFTN